MVEFLSWDADPPDPAGAIRADVITVFSVDKQADVTEHPVESGGFIADHVVHKPAEIRIELTQSEMPLEEDSELEWKTLDYPVRESQFQPEGLLLLTSAVGAAVQAVAGALGLSSKTNLKLWTLTAKTETDRILDLYEALGEVIDKNREVTITHKGQVLTGYVLTGVGMTREAGLAKISLSARHIQTVETAASSLLGGLPVPSVLRALPLQPFGKKSLKQVENDVQSRAGNQLGIGSLGEFL